jgi:hypothetical protein
MKKNPHFSVVAATALSLPNPLFVWTRVFASLVTLLVFSSSLCHAVQNCTLAWNASSDTTVAGYRVRYGTTSGSTAQTKDAGTGTGTTISGLSDGVTYYFTVVAYTSTNVESQPSNEVSYKAPTTPTGGTYNLTVVNGTGDGPYAANTTVPVSANSPGSGQTFSVWTGDWQILASRTSSSTTATMPSMDATITATYTGTSSSEKIRFFPRENYMNRMVGGIFEGTNGNPATGPYTTLFTVVSTPTLNWNEAGVSLGNYRYLRYRAPDGSYGNVAEIEFYRNGSKLSGSGFGTSGSYNNSGDTFAKALDGDTGTAFDGPTPNGCYVGLDTGSGAPTATPSPTPATTVRIWPSNAVPAVADSGSDASVELGVKFRSDVPGKITGIRFYKAAANTGVHVASLWTSTGTLLATATFTGETASGWQTVNFPTPVSITANTVYVASYHCDNGHYSADANYFSSTTGADNPPLHALPSTSSNRNGVFAYGNDTVFPNQSFNSNNYWVDVMFQN